MSRRYSPLLGPERFEDRLNLSLGLPLALNAEAALPLVDVRLDVTLAPQAPLLALEVTIAAPLIEARTELSLLPPAGSIAGLEVEVPILPQGTTIEVAVPPAAEPPPAIASPRPYLSSVT